MCRAIMLCVMCCATVLCVMCRATMQRQNSADQEVRSHEVESLERKLTEAEREAAAANVSNTAAFTSDGVGFGVTSAFMSFP